MGRWDDSSGKAWCAAVGDSGTAGEVGCSHEGRWWPEEREVVVAGEDCGREGVAVACQQRRRGRYFFSSLREEDKGEEPSARRDSTTTVVPQTSQKGDASSLHREKRICCHRTIKKK
ncbi:hypothetical protein B296_00054003 [Ensete ventricosum]|uniref:Uncharacterized protein n=1 Tax=Ensete ventricosum TaxID=4639 RepID=A0A426X8C7_ENSVE|nr:hypothetical protein B296_00054003 [Ensete ventricosum]